uniref:Hyaluronan-mediated motility receptor (RHAMM) n=1 Tax=Sparus aurata TaxID=8175 RepID=A0A671Z0T9_SPAAU
MSFSRAPLKRFNDNVGCAPPPGSYEIKSGELKGAASFDKSDRFRAVKAGEMPPPSPSRSTLVSPVRRTMSVDGLVEGSSVKREKNEMSMERKQQKLLEKEIRSLVQERGEQDRRLQALEEELKKVEAKLLSAVREKTGLSSNVTSLERQRAELKKVNEFLKNKVSADTTKKKINSLTMELMEAKNTVDVKNKELKLLQVNAEGHLKVLETDLQAARGTITALKDRNKDLAVIRELREEIKVLQGYLDEANEQIQEVRSRLYTMTLIFCLFRRQLETELEQRTTELQSTQNVLRQKEEEEQKFQQELQVSKDALVDAEKRLKNQELELKSSQESVNDMEEQVKFANQEVEDSQATVRQHEAELARLREVLRRTEKELDERVEHLELRYLSAEKERSKTQEEGLRRVEELKAEIVVLKEFKRDEKKRQIDLEQENASLTAELTKEKVTQKVLSYMEHSFFSFEAGKVSARLSVFLQVCPECQFDAFWRLASNSVSVLGSQTAFVLLFSAKEALKGAEEKRKTLETEVERVTRQMREVDKVLLQKDEEMKRVKKQLEEHQERQLAEAKAREENSGMLLEVQTRFAQKDEEMKAMEARHAALISQLQQQTKEREEALGQLEEQRGQSSARLQNERETAQKLLEEVRQEKEEIMEQLQQERDEKAQIQTALQEERGALEVERKDRRQARSEVLRLQANSDTEHWRKQYEELFTKVRPFQEQLNAFAAERKALLNENGANQEELNKLSDAYARLLGHQNQKQKIKHVMKLKDENISLKQEVSKLRSQVNRQKSDLEELRSTLPGAPRRRFDPSKAFQHDKENRQTETSEPLKEGEYLTVLSLLHLKILEM